MIFATGRQVIYTMHCAGKDVENVGVIGTPSILSW